MFSIPEFKSLFLFGIPLEKDNRPVPHETFEFYLKDAIAQLENTLSLKVFREIMKENKTFYAQDYRNWGYIRTTYPIVSPIVMTGYLGRVKQMQYPKAWMSIRKTSDNMLYGRSIKLVPNGSAGYEQTSALYAGLLPSLQSYGGFDKIPDYWVLEYITGFGQIPQDVKMVIGKLAAANILAMLNDSLQKVPGQSNSSISLDGLSQSTGTFASSSAGIFGARIKQYAEDIKQGLSRLRDQYTSVVMVTA